MDAVSLLPAVKLKGRILWQPQTSWPVRTLRRSQRSVAANAEHGRLAPILHAHFAVQTHALRRTIATARAGGGAEAVTAEEILHLHGSDVHEHKSETRPVGKQGPSKAQVQAKTCHMGS